MNYKGVRRSILQIPALLSRTLRNICIRNIPKNYYIITGDE